MQRGGRLLSRKDSLPAFPRGQDCLKRAQSDQSLASSSLSIEGDARIGWRWQGGDRIIRHVRLLSVYLQDDYFLSIRISPQDGLNTLRRDGEEQLPLAKFVQIATQNGHASATRTRFQ